jgi:hypothetical protein
MISSKEGDRKTLKHIKETELATDSQTSRRSDDDKNNLITTRHQRDFFFYSMNILIYCFWQIVKIYIYVFITFFVIFLSSYDIVLTSEIHAGKTFWIGKL